MKEKYSDQLEKGLVLPIMEEFYSIQGEGFHAGKAAYFIRIGGCDVGCSWCDIKESWNVDLFPPSDVNKLLQNALQRKARSIVVTGGEPLTFNLDYMCKILKKENFILFLETSGSEPLSGVWDWICLSPKKNSPPIKDIYKNANELKIIISHKEDFIWAEKNAGNVRGNCMLYLQPEWSRRDVVAPLIVEYILENPKWQVSMQAHKYLRIP